MIYKNVIFNGNYYSLDLMFNYINIIKPEITNVKLIDIDINLRDPTWEHYDKKTKKNILISISDVLNDKIKYSEHYNNIKNADLSYPIIIYNNIILDGYHRYSNAYMNNKSTIKAFVIKDKKMLDKFLIKDYNNFITSASLWEHVEKWNKIQNELSCLKNKKNNTSKPIK